MPYLLHALQDFGYFNKASTPVKRLQQPLNFNSFMTKGEYERQLARVYKQLQVGCIFLSYYFLLFVLFYFIYFCDYLFIYLFGWAASSLIFLAHKTYISMLPNAFLCVWLGIPDYKRQLARVYKQLQVGCNSLMFLTLHIKHTVMLDCFPMWAVGLTITVLPTRSCLYAAAADVDRLCHRLGPPLLPPHSSLAHTLNH